MRAETVPSKILSERSDVVYSCRTAISEDRETRHMTEFQTVLPRLVSTYEAGRLVPFIGSGMSVRACTDWSTFISKLEAAVSNEGRSAINNSTARDELIRRASSAVRMLKAREKGAFGQAVLGALVSDKNPAIPEQTKALARLWWPLVLSTNYDNCYEAAFHAQFKDSTRKLVVVGRSIEDCQRVLNSLSVAGRSLLWALQGYLNEPHSIPSSSPEDSDAAAKLREQLVVGHEEYRRVTYRDLHFRRAFAEVFRQRSLLFLGSGIQETYLQELFGEVLEYYGPSTRPHYAFIKEAEVDPDFKEFMLARFQIVTIQYEEHEEVVERLNQLADAASLPSRVAVAWSWGRIEQKSEDRWTSTSDLEVIRGPLPKERGKGECLAVSASGDSQFVFSPEIETPMDSWGIKTNEQPEKPIPPYLGLFPDRHVYAVRARSDLNERTLSDIYKAALALFEHRYRPSARPYDCIRMELLAARGTDKQEGTGDCRTYPERFSFVQIVRAWAYWRDQHPKVACRLALHIVLESVYRDVASGRIDVLELLSCKDIRFFAEIVSDTGEIERRLFQDMPKERLCSIVERLGLSPEHWKLQVTPPPSLEPVEYPLSARLDFTLQDLGVVPGSTLHFRRN